ncbi:TonB-dependent receptor [Algihabitans albus]|uniref:TonB-dependent receptor n=1 Tax=Algihabitans albus TaxID=2164067 RepID=UPI000E5D36F7|nr:TonB-dependent receptor [Algihabitans albus]
MSQLSSGPRRRARASIRYVGRRGRSLELGFCLLAGLLVGLPLQAAANESSSGLPFFQIQNGDVQPNHTSPIRQFEAVRGAGLDAARPPGRGVQPVADFLPRLRQHRDSRPLPIAPLFQFDRAPGDMPYRTDNIRLPLGTDDALRRNADHFKISGGYATPGDTLEALGQATLRRPEGYLRAFARGTDARDGFEGGDGQQVPFEYSRNSQQLVLGWTPSADFEAFAVLLRDDIDDDATPSSRLDNLETDRLVGRLGFELRDVPGEAVSRVRAEMRIRDVERVNNNFDVRDFTVAPGARRIEVENERFFIDGRLFGDFTAGAFENRLGLDWIVERRDGDRLTDLNAASPEPRLNGLASPLFPDIAVAEFGPTFETATSLSADDHMRFGLGYRFVHADAQDVDTAGQGPFANLAPGLPATASNLYDFYYGSTEVEQNDHLLSARAVYQHETLDDRLTLFGEVARTDRAADSKERYWAGTTPPPQAANRLVGNPELEPERHYQAAAGFIFDGPDWIDFGRARRGGTTLLPGAWQISGALRFSHVEDFITRDSARLQSGVLRNDGALIFRNVDANIFTAELDGQWNVTTNLSARANVIYSYGQNSSDKRPLYGIAPLEANLLLDYSDRLGSFGTWSLGGKLRLVADQTRVDDNAVTGSGFDEGETDGCAVLDLYAGAQLYDRIGLRLGVENVFDSDYREHVARHTLDSRQRSRIAAPGRSLFVNAIVTF